MMIRYEDLPEWVEVHDVQSYLSLGRSTIYGLIKRGDLPSKRFGRCIRIPKEALAKDGEGQQ